MFSRKRVYNFDTSHNLRNMFRLMCLGNISTYLYHCWDHWMSLFDQRRSASTMVTEKFTSSTISIKDLDVIVPSALFTLPLFKNKINLWKLTIVCFIVFAIYCYSMTPCFSSETLKEMH